MTDRELLERAARAAGAVHADSWDNGAMLVSFDGKKAVLWNSLNDDGDALRLAVKLRASISREDQGAVKVGWVANQTVPFASDGFGPWYWKEWLRDHDWDANAATRRAITRAAAEMAP